MSTCNGHEGNDAKLSPEKRPDTRSRVRRGGAGRRWRRESPTPLLLSLSSFLVVLQRRGSNGIVFHIAHRLCDTVQYGWVREWCAYIHFFSYSTPLSLARAASLTSAPYAWKTTSVICAVEVTWMAVTTWFVHYARRHLMVWAIFAPKFLFDAVNVLNTTLLSLATLALARAMASPAVGAPPAVRHEA